VDAEVSRQFEQLSEIVGRGAPLDSMARARALGIVALLERRLHNGAAQHTLERLRELVGDHESGHDGTPAESDRGARLVAALDDVRGILYDAKAPARQRRDVLETH
jgi:hypothetical protein